jgi:hypothetical protein
VFVSYGEFHKIAAPGSPGGTIYGNATETDSEGNPLGNTSPGDDNASAAVCFGYVDAYKQSSTWGPYVAVDWVYSNPFEAPVVTDYSQPSP